MPGTIALGATGGLTVTEAKKSKSWSQKQDDDIELARELTKTCWGMYKASATGLAPEITHFNISDPPRFEVDGRLSSADISFESTANASWKADYMIKSQDSHNLQRPETVETLFYMWRITGETMYREWGWEMFKSFVKYTAAVDGSGFTSLSKANQIPPVIKDDMESFWLVSKASITSLYPTLPNLESETNATGTKAETLKYFYLLFSPTDLLPLDQIVINTEAHIFPRFELQRGLKTGWHRKPRDSKGHIIPDAPMDIAPARHTVVKENGGTKPTVKRVQVTDSEPDSEKLGAKTFSG
ncbi:MAG: hypothetical protein Q9187_001113 [Circinaria calcarea]